MKPQFIEKDGKTEFVVLPYEEYNSMIDELEDLQDLRDFDTAMKKIEEGEKDFVSSTVVYRILDGIHPVKAWREYRKMSLNELARQCKVSGSAISMIENGKREPSIKLLKVIAEALEVDLDDLVV